MKRDEDLPEDLGATERRLREGRSQLTPLQADELRRRVDARLTRASAGRGSRRGTRGLAALLVSGAMLTSGASVVLATTAATNGSTSTILPSTTHPKDGGGCQYHPSYHKEFTFSYSGGTTKLTIDYDCKTGKFTVTVICSKPIAYYYCNGKKVTVPGTTRMTTFVLTAGVHSVSVTSGGKTATFPLLLIP